MLQNILGQLGGTSTAPNSSQTNAVDWLTKNAYSAPNFGDAATNTANTLLAGGPTNYSGILSSGYDTLKGQLQPFASGSMVGKNAGLQAQLDTAANDATNAVNSQFAAAGRPAGTNAAVAQATARGVGQAQAPIIANQYNQDLQNQINAASELYGASGSTASGLTGMTQTQLTNQLAGLGAAGQVPGILNQNAQSLLSAGNTGQALPYSGIGILESLVNPIAGLGAQSSGTSTGTSTQQTNPLSNILGAGAGAAGILGGTGAFGSAGWLAPLMAGI